MAPVYGIQTDEVELIPILKPHQRAAIKWAIEGGRRALFESFGLLVTMHSREVYRHHRHAYAAFTGFAGCDYIIKQKRAEGQDKTRLYTYEEMCNEVPARAKQEDFDRIVINGRPMYRRKTIHKAN